MVNDDHEFDTCTATETEDPLTALLRRAAHDLLKQAVEVELQAFLNG